MPRPSCRRYSSTPRPAPAMACRLASNWAPQSHFRLYSVSPVRHSLCRRVSTGWPSSSRPRLSAACSPLPRAPTRPCRLNSPHWVGRRQVTSPPGAGAGAMAAEGVAAPAAAAGLCAIPAAAGRSRSFIRRAGAMAAPWGKRSSAIVGDRLHRRARTGDTRETNGRHTGAPALTSPPWGGVKRCGSCAPPSTGRATAACTACRWAGAAVAR